MLSNSLHQHTPNQAITATGAARRLQGLAALGWTRSDLAWRLDQCSREQLRRLFAGNGRRDLLPRVAALYDQLAGSVPADTWDARGARGEARYRGWLPPAAWPDQSIDDPAATPVSVAAQLLAPATETVAETASQRHARTWHRAGALVDDLEWLLDTGETLHGACRRLGMSSASLYKALGRAHRLDLWSRLTSGAAAA